MLPDETCWFLAADFDKASWKQDIAAFRDTARAKGVPVAIERSRSGNGAHAWIFFKEPVAASDARRLGALLVTATMDRCPDIGFDSYDRFFPSQDTIPAGGFGNKAYPCVSGATKCCSRSGELVIGQITNTSASDDANGRLSPFLDRVPAALLR
jgi:hypothetical protein